MDHEDRVIRVNHENDLEQAPGLSRAPYEVLLIVLRKRKRWLGAKEHLLCLVGLDAVCSDVLFVPVVPSEVQGSSTLLII